MANILVVGDTIQDEYVFGNIERVNPEAPYCLVLDYEYSKRVLGGAANVAANIKSLDRENTVHYLGYVSPETSEMLTKAGVKYLSSELISNSDMLLKTRYVYDNHIILRLDTNKDYKSFLNTKWSQDLLFRVEHNLTLKDIDVVVVSDYAKKTLTNELLEKIFHIFNDKLFMFDIKKPINTKTLPKKNVFKCNLKEWDYLESMGFTDTLEMLDQKCFFTRTEGRHGYSVLDRSINAGGILISRPAINVGEIVDTVGCGDVFLAGMVVDYCKDLHFDLERHSANGNKAAAIKVKKFGTSLVTKEEMEKNV